MPKEYRKGIQRFRYIGSGAFTKAKKVLPNIKRKTPQPLKDKVVKQLSEPASLEELKRTRQLITNYSEILRRAGIPVMPTTVRGGLTKRGKFVITLIQDYVPKHLLVAEIFKSCSISHAQYLTREILELINKAQSFNKINRTQIGIDTTIKNFGIVNGKVMLIDTYPAYIKNTLTIKSTDYTDRKRRWYHRIPSKLFKERARVRGDKRINKRFNAEEQQKQLLASIEKIRPEFKQELLQLLN